MKTTGAYKLTLFDLTDTDVSFQYFRDRVCGSGDKSNMVILEKVIRNLENQITILKADNLSLKQRVSDLENQIQS